MSLQTGQILQGRYVISSHVGRGGMGAVYQGQDRRLNNRPVALKELDPAQVAPAERQAALHAFQQEAAILAGLSHPGLTAVYDHFLENNKYYLVMEFVHGENLEQAWQRVGRLFSEAQVVAWTRELCDVLTYLHSQQPPIIFRDLKPANIMVQPNGRLKLIDFGIARHFDPAKTSDTVRFGTPGYAAPEQYGQGQTDARSDVYALGVVTHQLLTGHDPGATPFNLPDVASFPVKVSTPVTAAVRRALQMDPAQRPPTAVAFAQLLTQTRTAASLGRGRKWGLVALGGALTLLVSGLFFWNSREPPLNTSPPAMVEERRASTIVEFTPTLISSAAATAPITTPATAMETATATAMATATATAVRTLTVTPTPTANASGAQVSAIDGMAQLFISAGEFTMGSNDGDDDEQPIHSVYLSAYWIDATEVTNAMFAQFVATTNYLTTAEEQGWGRAYNESAEAWQRMQDANWRRPQGPGSNLNGLDNHPVVQVSWFDAVAYCEWAGRRLPTEAEWERAARGVDERVYPWGNQFDGSRLNFCDRNCPFNWKDSRVDDGYRETAPAGSYPTGSSPTGALDMAGNVWEWVRDWYSDSYYQASPARDPQGPSSGEGRVIRGGAWINFDSYTRASYRSHSLPAVPYYFIGFRCAQ